MGRVATIGDIGGHPDQLRRALAWLGATEGGFPPDLTVIQVGDLVDRGPDSAGVLDIVAELLDERRWIQLVGNHEAQYLPGGAVFWREPLAEGDVARLREWWDNGRLRIAEAVRTAEGEEFLVTHAGLTLTCWQRLGEPMSAAEAAKSLNKHPELVWDIGEHGRDGSAGPLWAESGAALHPGWAIAVSYPSARSTGTPRSCGSPIEPGGAPGGSGNARLSIGTPATSVYVWEDACSPVSTRGTAEPAPPTGNRCFSTTPTSRPRTHASPATAPRRSPCPKPDGTW
ncbi:metallophosphoesterase family protein [Amycolatopsis azurea]|uniref:metallophosphoesterase family protein n=1 Tax=Amycolatopsis azurea TaxID=36819 RepID=UPI003806BBCD